MALTAGELMATMRLDMQPFEAGLSRAKEEARTAGGRIAGYLLVEPRFETEAFTTSLNLMVEQTKKAAARIKGEMGTLHGNDMELNLAGAEKVRAQLQSVIGDAHRLRTLIDEPLVLGGADDARLKAELTRLQEQMDRLRASASSPIRMSSSSSSSSAPSESSSSMGKLGGGMLRNAGYMAGSAAIFAVGAALTSTIKQTADFETEINTLGAVTGATGSTLATVSKKALDLGADFTIANASASDAAVVMTQLVKGGLSVQGAMDAARGSLQLASAGGVSFVQAADLETAALAQFGLGAKEASRVADVLANSAHAARGTVSELGTGLTYAGTVAHQAGYSLEQTAGVLALFAKFGLTGSLGGTTLKDFIMRVEKAAVSTGAAGAAYKQLGLDVYNQNGTLKDAGQIANQLGAAHKKLAPQIYNSAMQTLLGARAITGGNILMAQGAVGLKAMVDKTASLGGAASFSAARMKGLGGSFANLKNQVETAQVELGEKFSPALQNIVNQVAAAVPKISAFMTGPSIGSGFSKLGDFFAPMVNGAKDLVSKAMPYISDFIHSVGQGFGSIVDFIHPVVIAIGDFWKHAADNGSVALVANVFDELGTAFKNTAKFLVPVGDAIGHVIGWVGGLGTFGTVLGTVATAMLAFKLISPLLLGVARFVPGFSAAEGAVKSFGKTYAALGSTGMGRVASAMGAAVQGAANLGKGLLAAFGGPVGLAIMGITTVIALWPTLMDKLKGSETSAATVTKNHADAVTALSAALETSNGKIDETIRKSALDTLHSASWGRESKDVTAYADRLANLGISYSTLVDGMLNVPGAAVKINSAYDAQVKSLQGVITAGTKYTATRGGAIASYSDEAKAAQGNLTILRQLHDGYAGQVGTLTESNKLYKKNADAVKDVAAAMTVGSGGMKDLKTNTGDMTAALDAARASAAKTATPMTDISVRIGEISHAAKLAGDDTSAFYEIVKGAKGKPDTVVTPMTQAFADYKQAVTDADTTTQIFITTMDRLAGRNVSIEDAMRTNAAAARGIGAAGRKREADAAALQDAKDGLVKAQTGHVGTQEDATAATDKSTIATDKLAKAEAALAKLQGGTRLSQTQITAAQDKSTIAAGRLASAEAALQKMERSGKATAAGLAAAHARVDLAQQRAAAAADKAAAAQSGVGSASTASASQIAAAQARVDLAQIAATKSANAAATATANVGKQATSGTAYADNLAAAQLKVADAQNTLAGSADGIIAADETYQKTAAMNVLLLSEQADKQHGFAYAVKVGTAEMQKQRDAFIAQQPAADIASGAAARLADHYGLIPKNVVTLLSGDPKLAVEAAAVAKAAIDKATQDRITTLKVATADAIVDIKAFGGDIKSIPALYRTKFDADVATAAAEGLNLYRVYNKTTGKWTALFETPNSAAAQRTAGNLVHQYDQATGTWTATFATPNQAAAKSVAIGVVTEYDKAKGTWTAAFEAKDNATAKVQAIMATIANIPDKTVQLDIATAVNNLPTSLQASGAALAAGFAANGGKATGGPIVGPGTGTSDDVPIWASAGEFMHTAKDYARNKAAVHYIHAGGTIPDQAIGRYATGGPIGGLTVNATEHGDASAAVSGISALFSRASSEAAASNAKASAAAAAAKASAAAVPAASSAGVEQWRALALQVAAAKGEDPASVQVMLNQMSRESSGNPAAINLTDSNAIAGHPSVGLLQFIPDTFRRNADPGFNTNIYDPASQMHAWYNYLAADYGGWQAYAHRSGDTYGAYAQGGPIRGAGTGTSDSVPIMASAGEFMHRAKDYQRNKAAVHYIHSGGTIAGFANGGVVGGSALALSGHTAASLGPELSNVVSALADIAQAVRDARDAVAPKRDLQAQAWSARNAAKQQQWDNRIAAQNRLHAAQAKQGTENGKTSATERLIDRQKVTAAARALAATVAADNTAVAKATRDWAMARRTAISYQNAAVAAERFQAAQQRAYRTQQAYAAQVDKLNGWLTTAQANLANLKSNRSQMMGGISSTVSGFDSGILGHPDTRNTIATMIKGQQYDVAQAQKFNVNIARARKLGLSNDSLNQIAAAGVDGGGTAAAAIAAATPKQVKQLNALTAQMHRIGDNVGNMVAGQFYDAGIQAANGMVHGLESQIGAIDKVMIRFANASVASMKRALGIHSPSRLFHDQVGVPIGMGVHDGIRSTIPAVARATSGLVTVPRVRPMAMGGSSMVPPVFNVKVFVGDREITDIARVEVKHGLIGLGHALKKGKAQG